MSSLDAEQRYATEIELLQSMYAEQIRETNRELNFITSNGHLLLRIPEGYLVDALPEVILASMGHKDAREDMKGMISTCMVGEENLDTILQAFLDMQTVKELEQPKNQPVSTETSTKSTATVVIWLHHLLNTNKRKQCLSPDESVSGITKPGYPGVLIYSGPSKAVHDHVNELKQLNWAAFQVRLELETEWQFKHGKGVIEVEAMKDIVGEIGEENKETFLESMRMK